MMFYSHKFNQNLVGHLIIAGLLVFISQSTAENECQKDPIKTGQELLASAQTLFYGENSERFDSDMAIKLVKKYSVGVLCCQNIEPKFGINANFKNLQNNFCQQLKNGKNMEEASGNAESSAINLMQNLDKPKILQNIRQKIAKNSFLDEKNREKMAQLLGHFQIGIDKFYGVIKARKLFYDAQQQPKTDHKKGALMRQSRRKRSDVNPTIIYGDRSGTSSGRQNSCIAAVLCAIVFFGVGIIEYFRIGPHNAFELLVISAVFFSISVLLSIIFCCSCRG